MSNLISDRTLFTDSNVECFSRSGKIGHGIFIEPMRTRCANERGKKPNLSKLEAQNMIQSSGKERLYCFFFGARSCYLMGQEPQMRAKRGSRAHIQKPHTRSHTFCSNTNKCDEHIFDVIEKKAAKRRRWKKNQCRMLEIVSRSAKKQCIARTMLILFVGFFFRSPCAESIVWFVPIYASEMLLAVFMQSRRAATILPGCVMKYLFKHPKCSNWQTSP